MTKGITGKEPDPRVVYADIIDKPHHVSSVHPHMSMHDRAAQFSAYKALSGFEDMVSEEARTTEAQTELSEAQMELLGQKLDLISDVIADGEHPLITFTVFVPDERKAGGKYVDTTDYVKRIDTVNQTVVLMKKRQSGMNETIAFNRISDIHGDLVDYMDDGE